MCQVIHGNFPMEIEIARGCGKDIRTRRTCGAAERVKKCYQKLTGVNNLLRTWRYRRDVIAPIIPTPAAVPLQQMYQLYLDSLLPHSTRRPGIIGDLEAIWRSAAEAQDSLAGRQYEILARLINLRLPLPDALLRPPVQGNDPLAGLPDLPVPDPRAVTEAEAVLARDPCRPDLWLLVAIAHLKAGNAARSHQLLRRLAASGFPERAKAQDILSRSVALAYRCAA